MERMNLFQDINKPQITFYFAECMEFPDYGEYKEFPTLAQAISLFEKCPGTLLNAVKCVGFILHDDSIYDDVKQPLMTSKHVLKDDINYISHYANTTLVQEAIKEAENYLRNIENSQPKVTTGMFDNCAPLPAEMRENFKFTEEDFHILDGIGKMFKNDKSINFEIMQGTMPYAPIQDENRFLSFTVEGKSYSLKIVSKEEMQRVKEEVNKNSRYTYDWFKEETGDHHWVLYNTDMYEINNCGGDRYLHYIELSGLLPMVPINATSCHYMFSNCCNMEELDLKHFNTENIITIECMFSECSKISKLDLSCFNTAKVTNMLGMFSKCYNLEELDLNSFNTENVTHMINMFKDCESLKTLNLSSFNTENVTDMYGMFKNCVCLKKLDLGSFSTGNVINMSTMFSRCNNLEQLDLSGFDTINVELMDNMFRECSKLKYLDLSSFNTGDVIYMSSMFEGCISLESINLSSFVTTKVKTMEAMFKNCKELTTLNLRNFKTDRLEEMSEIFSGCSKLTILNLNNFNTAKAKYDSDVFKGCNALTTVRVGNRFSTDLERMLKKNIEGIKIIQCAALKRIKSRSFPEDYNIN